jgi:hypothetical protein
MELTIAAIAFTWIFFAFSGRTLSDDKKSDKKPEYIAKIYKNE